MIQLTPAVSTSREWSGWWTLQRNWSFSKTTCIILIFEPYVWKHLETIANCANSPLKAVLGWCCWCENRSRIFWEGAKKTLSPGNRVSNLYPCLWQKKRLSNFKQGNTNKTAFQRVLKIEQWGEVRDPQPWYVNSGPAECRRTGAADGHAYPDTSATVVQDPGVQTPPAFSARSSLLPVVTSLRVASATTVSRSRKRLKKLPWVPPELLWLFPTVATRMVLLWSFPS